MRLDGCEILAQWRELGEWWNGEPYREYTRYIDAKGIRRERAEDLGVVVEPKIEKGEVEEDIREDWSLRVHKKRDEKMALARLSYQAVDETRAPGIREGEASGMKLKPSSYVPLHVLTGYAFGRSTMMPEELAMFASMIGAPAMAITDPYSLVGAVEFTRACKGMGVKPLLGASFELSNLPGEFVLIAKSKVGYCNLSQLISACHLEESRQFPITNWDRLQRFSRDLICLTGGDGGPLNLLLTRHQNTEAEVLIQKLVALYGSSNVFIEIERSYLPWQIVINKRLEHLAEHMDLTCVAGGLVTQARPDHAPVQDMLTCIESLCTIEEVIGRKPRLHEARPERPLNAERFLRDSNEMTALYSNSPNLLQNTKIVAERCDEDVLPSRTQLPCIYPDPNHALKEITWMGANLRYPKITKPLKNRIERELERIQRLSFSGHFLTMWDACRWAQDQQIRFSGRG